MKFIRHFINIRGKRLSGYRYSVSGGMLGGYERETISRVDDKTALIKFESTPAHNKKPEIKEYTVDASVLDELDAIIRKYRMNFWHRKKFSNMFVCDGESRSFSFDFDDVTVNFSSQIYPEYYDNKLNELRNIIKRYI